MTNREPSISSTAFNCPHCGAYTSQTWYDLRADEMRDGGTPMVASSVASHPILTDPKFAEEHRTWLRDWHTRLKPGFVLMNEGKGEYLTNAVENLHLSKCYNCKKLSVWVAENLVFPPHKLSTPANADLPDDIVANFEEARSIVDASPRGAAALLRLCVQKLCSHLGERGKKIDDDIGSLVKKGLNPVVQKSLDIVRVIGNESVHPGVIDLNDDRNTALSLFDLVNAIADQMISHPKKVSEMYEKLPDDKKKGIERRDKA